MFLTEKLLPELQLYILNNINNKYLNNNYLINKYNINGKNIIILGINALEYKEHQNHFIIQINPNIRLPKITAKLYDACCDINYGSLNVPPYPIFSDAFNWAQQNKYKLYLEYLEEDY